MHRNISFYSQMSLVKIICNEAQCKDDDEVGWRWFPMRWHLHLMGKMKAHYNKKEECCYIPCLSVRSSQPSFQVWTMVSGPWTAHSRTQTDSPSSSPPRENLQTNGTCSMWQCRQATRAERTMLDFGYRSKLITQVLHTVGESDLMWASNLTHPTTWSA